ncbi:MAG: alpha/beta hydrolase [Nitrospira sp.]|nr:alpha/beta hydrolase [Nitrospira sp.]
MFIHGAGQDHTIWVLPTRYFVRHQRNVLSVDLPGHGRSDGPPLPTIEDMADWVIALFETTGLETTAVVGHSMGTLVALETAVRHADRVRAVAMVGTSVPMPVSDALLDNASEDKHLALDMLTLWGHSRAAHLGGNSTPGMWMLGGGIRLLERAGPGVVYNDLQACAEYSSGLNNAATVSCPVLLILGQRDAMTPARAAVDVSKALPNAETVVMEGSGHALLSERPDPVLDELIRIV